MNDREMNLVTWFKYLCKISVDEQRHTGKSVSENNACS